MDGYTWVYDTSVDPFPDILTYNGVSVWDTAADKPLSHSSIGIDWECYCYLTVDWDFGDLEEKMRQLKEMANMILHEMAANVDPVATAAGGE